MEDQDKMRRVRAMIYKACERPDQLHMWLRGYLGLNVPQTNVCPDHCAPFDYVKAAYFEPAEDLVVWAPRGGGKTRLGAAVTLLDLLHKPGVNVRILGGSLEQSCRMWEHLRPDVNRVASQTVDRKASSGKHLTLRNGAKAGVLAQSQKAVRGIRVQKLRCDEVELFDPRVWEAGQLTTRSLRVLNVPSETPMEDPHVKGTVEAISTFHKPWGLMSKVIENARSKGQRVLHWCMLEVMERCPASRDCATCDLYEDCRGIAKTRCDGFYGIDDLITLKRRVSKECWDCEMMCRKPNVKGAVFPYFDVKTHVREGLGCGVWGSANANAPQAATLKPTPQTPNPIPILAMDFGFHNPFVCLWIMSYPNGVVHVVDEYVQSSRMLHEHVAEIESRRWGRAQVITCDPAGNGRNDQTAESNISFLKRRGYTVKAKGSRIVDGIEKIRFALKPAIGEPTLFIASGCKELIASMQGYHYAEEGSELPLKDGNDHCVDALRYFFVNRGSGPARWRKY